MEKSIKTKSVRLVALSDKPLTEQELIHEVKKAESGSFISVAEGMKDFEQWLKTRERK